MGLDLLPNSTVVIYRVVFKDSILVIWATPLLGVRHATFYSFN